MSREISKYTSGLACNAHTHTRMHTLWSGPGHCTAGRTVDKEECQLPAHGVWWAQGRHVVALGLGSSNNCLLAGATRGVSHGGDLGGFAALLLREELSRGRCDRKAGVELERGLSLVCGPHRSQRCNWRSDLGFERSTDFFPAKPKQERRFTSNIAPVSSLFAVQLSCQGVAAVAAVVGACVAPLLPGMHEDMCTLDTAAAYHPLHSTALHLRRAGVLCSTTPAQRHIRNSIGRQCCSMRRRLGCRCVPCPRH